MCVVPRLTHSLMMSLAAQIDGLKRESGAGGNRSHFAKFMDLKSANIILQVRGVVLSVLWCCGVCSR